MRTRAKLTKGRLPKMNFSRFKPYLGEVDKAKDELLPLNIFLAKLTNPNPRLALKKKLGLPALETFEVSQQITYSRHGINDCVIMFGYYIEDQWIDLRFFQIEYSFTLTSFSRNRKALIQIF